MPHWFGYLNIAVATMNRYDETEARLFFLYPLMNKIWRFLPTGKESSTLFLSQQYVSSTDFCKVKHIFPNGKTYSGIYSTYLFILLFLGSHHGRHKHISTDFFLMSFCASVLKFPDTRKERTSYAADVGPGIAKRLKPNRKTKNKCPLCKSVCI